MAKKSKNSELLVHYTRTMTPENLSRAANYVGGYVLRGLGALGKIFTAPLTGGPLGPATVVLPKTRELLDAERKLRETQELLIGKAMTWVSPLNYGAALATGNGLNARKGEEEVASWSPAWLATARLIELGVGPKAVKGVKSAPRVVVNTAAKAGSKTAKKAVVAREINKAVKNKPNVEIPKTETRTRVGDVEIDNPLLAYRLGNGIIEDFLKTGKVRTPDQEGYGDIIVDDPKLGRFNFGKDFDEPMFALGRLWYGLPRTNAGDLLVTSEPLALANKYSSRIKSSTNGTLDVRYAGFDNGRIRSRRVLTHEGLLTPKNTTAYKWIPGYGYKQVVKEPSTSLAFFERKPSTIQISPEELYKVFKDQELNGYYFMGHGTGRTNVNPLVIFDNGLRIKSGDIGNTTSPISESNLSLWPHANSKEVIILPGKAENVRFDSARGRIPSDWYDNKTFQWEDNPGFEGSGLFAVLKPNATFVETEINGVPGVYTKPEAILGSYNIDTHTLKLNPKSLYEFLFNTPRTIIKNKETELYALRDNTGGSSKITVPDVYKSLTEAAKYKGSKGYRELVHRAQKEAEEMGLSFNPDLYLEINKHLPSIKLNSRPEGRLGGYRKSTNTIELDPDLLSPIEGKYVPFHEGLHWLRVGTPELNSPLYNRWKLNMRDELAWHDFYHSEEYSKLKYEDNAKAYARKKVKEALYEDADPYLSIPGELLANGLEAGRAIGLEPFAEYPGYGKALEAAEKARNYNKWLHDVKAGTTLEMLNFWKILTGNYLPAVSIPLTTGYTLYNIFNQPHQQLQYLKQGGKMNIIKLFKEGGQIRKMLTASGGPIINGGTPFSITVKGKDRRPAWKRMYLNPNLGDTSKYYNGNILEGVIGLTPGIGDAIDAVKAADAVNNKDYATAGFLGAGLLLPNIIEKPLKFARGLYKGYKANKMMKAARKAYDESGEKLEVDAFKSGSKPMYVTPAKGPGSNHIDVISDELKDSKYLDLERPFGKDRTLTLRYYINEGKLKQTIRTYKDLYKDRLGLYTNDVDKIYNHIISNPKLLDLNVNPGTTGLLDIIGVSLGYGPKDAILFKIGYNGLNTGEKVSKDAIESMKTYGYDRTLPGIYNILKKNIERGTLGVKSTNTNGGHVGFGYIKNKLGGMLQLLKNGSGIHIKEKNKGKFTSYCGGKVTDECILKGKNSSNPAIRKRATFAANARKWKHKDGGFFLSLKVNKHLAFVPGASITDSNPRAYSQIKKHKGDTEWIDKSSKGLKVKSNLNPKYYLKRKVEKASKGTAFGLTISNALGKVGNFFQNNKLGLSILSTGINLGLDSLTNSANKNVISNEAEISKANVEKNAANEKLNNSAKAEEMARNTLALLYDKDNPNAFEGGIVKGQLKLKFLNWLNVPIDQELAALKALIDFLANQLKNLYSIGSLGGLSTDILNAFSNNKKDTSTNNSTFGNYVSTLFKNYGTFNSDGSMNLGNGLGTFSVNNGYTTTPY